MIVERGDVSTTGEGRGLSRLQHFRERVCNREVREGAYCPKPVESS